MSPFSYSSGYQQLDAGQVQTTNDFAMFFFFFFHPAGEKCAGLSVSSKTGACSDSLSQSGPLGKI